MARTPIVCITGAIGILGLLTTSCGTGSPLAGPDEQLFQDAMAHYYAGDCLAALPLFDQMAVDYPDSRRADNSAYLSGRCSYKLGDFAVAVTKLTQMRADFPTSSLQDQATYFTARGNFRQGEAALTTLEATPFYQAALPDFELVPSLDPVGVFVDNAAYYVGRTHFELGQYANAELHLGNFETNFVGSSYIDNARYYLGRTFFDQGQFTNAIAPFQRVLANPPSIYEDSAAYLIARCHYGLLNYDLAYSELGNLSAAYPTSQYLDNALYYQLRIHVDRIPQECGLAAAKRSQLETTFPTSPLIPNATNYMTLGGCP